VFNSNRVQRNTIFLNIFARFVDFQEFMWDFFCSNITLVIQRHMNAQAHPTYLSLSHWLLSRNQLHRLPFDYTSTPYVLIVVLIQ
jgi:hypothetical protein